MLDASGDAFNCDDAAKAGLRTRSPRTRSHVHSDGSAVRPGRVPADALSTLLVLQPLPLLLLTMSDAGSD